VIDRQSYKRPRMSLVSGDMLFRKQNDEMLLRCTLICTLYSLPSALHAPVPAAVWHGARHLPGNRAMEQWSDRATERRSGRAAER
jgi:hypothetical protein